MDCITPQGNTDKKTGVARLCLNLALSLIPVTREDLTHVIGGRGNTATPRSITYT